MKIVWVVKLGKQKVLWETFREALEDYRNHEDYLRLLPNPAWIYPRLISKARFDQLKEHNGW
jgi:hypothetical protein